MAVLAFFKTPLGKYLGLAILFALLALAMWRWLDSYGDRRFDEGVAATDAKWQAESEKLRVQAAQSATRADDAAVNRLVEHVEQVAAEQEQVNEAIRNGSSPFDVLFGSEPAADGVRDN
jgi:hypothetical protein